MGATRTLCVLMGMVLWSGSGGLEKWVNDQRMSLHRQRRRGAGGQAAGRVPGTETE